MTRWTPSKTVRLLAAKTDPQGGGFWLPLWMHAMDTSWTLQFLALYRLPEAVRRYLCPDEGLLIRTLRFLGFLHDIGKATALFQNKILHRLPDIRQQLSRLLPVPDSFENPGGTSHARASEAILLSFGCPRGVASVAGAHHGWPQEDRFQDSIVDNMDNYPDSYWGPGGERGWRACWQEMLDGALAFSGLSGMEELPALSKQQQVLLCGLLVMADWIASNTRYFPLIPVDTVGSPSLYPARAEAAWRELDLPGPWESGYMNLDIEAFTGRFGFPPNRIQQAVLDTVSRVASPGLLILEGQMGCGKTEAALAAGEVLGARFGFGGLYFGLPTQATANGIFGRLLCWAENQSEDAAHAIRLAHGMANLNEDYISLFQGTAQTDEADENLPENGVLVHEWFQGNKQALLSDFVVGTIDQLLMAALVQRHVMLRHLGLAGKVVVVDECHAYDAYMNCYLDRALKWLGAYHVPVILLSATLPAGRRAELVESYLGCKPEGLRENCGYPLLTWTDGQKACQAEIPVSTPSTTVRLAAADEARVAGLLEERMREGGCAGVIVNTVKKAQALASRLRDALPGYTVILFHAQFLMPDRAEKERVLLERLGKRSGPSERDRLIVVGTQVLEQSLDIDFDLLVSELCPMDLLLQRIGRLHRHRRESRPVALREACCFVLDTGDGTFDAGSVAVYGEWLLWRTRQLLPDSLLLPEDISPLVQKVYGWENGDPLPETDASRRMKGAYLVRRLQQVSRAQKHEIPKPPAPPKNKKPRPRLESLDNWLQDDDIYSESAARAAVRDGDPSIDLLLMVRRPDGRVTFLPWQEQGAEVRTDCPPLEEESRAIARQKLRLPGYFSRRWTINKVIRQLENENRKWLSQWQQSPLLRGELVLLLDEALEASLAGMRLKYDRQDGLTYREEETNEGKGI